ncbi:MAG: cyclase family protein [Betaproteobacteria bacterium]|nr:cyclase family protein [Betaproteobacteria bacterium]
MRSIAVVWAVLAVLLSGHAWADGWSPPAPEQRCPSKWGATDERGAANYMTPERVLHAARLVKTGETVELGHVLSGDIPLFGTRRFELYTKRTTPPLGTNRRRSNEEIVFTEIGQVGTQMDMLSHQTIGDLHYNCFDTNGIATRTGFSHLGIEKVGMLFTRGVLLDIAALKGVDTLAIDYEITPADLKAAAEREGVEIRRGDAVLVNTGWGRLWGADNAKYNSGCPGIGIAAAEWLAAKDVMLIGADNFPVEIAPNPDKSLSFPVHQIALVVNGIFLIENLKLDELAHRKVYEFAFAMQPLKIAGGTGSTVAPVAMY